MNYNEDSYVAMIDSFRTNDLQALLGAFNRNRAGRKSELKDRVLDLFRNRPVGLNYLAYLSKIVEIYRSLQNDTTNSDILRNVMQNHRQQNMAPISMQQAQQPRLYQPPQYPQQPMHMSRAGLPQVMPQMQRGIYGNSMSGSHNIPYNYQPAVPRNMVSQVPMNQQVNVIGNDHLIYDTNTSNSFTPSSQSLTNVRFKKLPFYEINAELLKPSLLVGHDRCSLPNVPRGMKEATFKITLTADQATIIAMNRDISSGKNEYIYQIQIRICLFEPELTEITDYMPLGLNIRINNKACQLPPTAPNTRPGTEARRTARPINGSLNIKLNPMIANTFTVNWTPDAKTYAIGIYLVKKLTSKTLIQKLHDKGTRSSEETKNYIIKKLADVDPDLATTSYRFSLVCPLGKMRMKIPAKSIKCNHLQCFDASTFILMNEKKPTWTCPTCNQPCLYDEIQIESYFMEVVSSPNLPDSCKEIEILADGTWKVYEENKDHVNPTVDPKETPIDSVNLDDSDDENFTEVKKESNLVCSKESDHMKSSFVDLTLSDDDEPVKEKDKQGNEAQAADDAQSVTSVNLKPQAQVQPQQAVTSSEQGVVIEIDCSPSPPRSPIPRSPTSISAAHPSPTHTSPTPTSPTPTSPTHTSPTHTSPTHTSPTHGSPIHTSPTHTSPTHTSPTSANNTS